MQRPTHVVAVASKRVSNGRGLKHAVSQKEDLPRCGISWRESTLKENDHHPSGFSDTLNCWYGMEVVKDDVGKAAERLGNPTVKRDTKLFQMQ